MNSEIQCVIEKLAVFCKKNDVNFDSFICKNKLETISSPTSSEEKIKQAILRMIQGERNRSIWSCMCELKNICEELDIKYVFLKGLALAQDLYSPPTARQFYDIDILVTIHDLPRLLEVLTQRGFRDRNGAIMYVDEALQRIEKGHQHINDLHKHYINNDVTVEIHVSPNERAYELFGKAISDLTYTPAVLAHRTFVSINSIKFPVPCITDTLYILAMHMVMHLCLDLSLYLYARKPFRIYPIVKMTIDIALFILKHELEIDWKQLISTANQYRCTKLLSYALYLVSDIYGFSDIQDKIPRDIEPSASPCSEICDILLGINPSEYIIHQTLKNTMDAVVKKNALLRKDHLPCGFTLKRMCTTVQIQIPITKLHQKYCIDIYNTNLDVDVLCTEYIFEFTDPYAKVYRDNGYNILWDVDTFGSCRENELMICYSKSDAKISLIDKYCVITIANDEIGFDCNDATIIITEINYVNPFITKHFLA